MRSFGSGSARVIFVLVYGFLAASRGRFTELGQDHVGKTRDSKRQG